jgi:FKBP-type peptidyl-prolyl cis-trans isomerase 2
MVEKGNKVKITYEGKLESGEVFDSSDRHGGKPLEFVVGSGMVIKGFDDAVRGMEKGEEKEFTIEPNDAYGDIKDDLKKEVPKNALPQDQEFKEGMVLIAKTPEGQQMPVKIEKINEESVVVDFNHPLAGKKLIFKIKVEDVEAGESSQ